MPGVKEKRSLLRTRGEHDSGRVGFVELFFDLVFVFAVTQLSHTLLADLTRNGLAESALLLLGVWWVWINTSWVTNWLDPERIPVRIAILALMLAGLWMSVAIPKAFDSRGWLFAGAYVAMQLGRTLFFLWAVRREHPNMRRNFHRILAWLVLSSICWIAGGVSTFHSSSANVAPVTSKDSPSAMMMNKAQRSARWPPSTSQSSIIERPRPGTQ